MPTYLMLNQWTARGIENVKGAPERIAKAREMAKSMGCEFKGCHVLMGHRYDTAVLMEAPDDAAIARFAMTLAALGNVRTETMRAFTEEEFKTVAATLP